MKAAYYPDVGLEQMVPDQMWIEEECKYDIAAMYGISHWWFQRQRFYIDRHASEGTDNQEKDEKQSQNDKTGLGMEKTVKDKAKSKPESQSSQKVNRKVNWSKSKSTQVNPGAKVQEI
ncbi:hypothetical protein Tco_0438131 [Tanacetum coccineum]